MSIYKNINCIIVFSWSAIEMTKSVIPKTYSCKHVCVCVLSLSGVRLFAILWAVAARVLCPWSSPGKNTEVGYHFLLQGIFLTQGLNTGLLQA